jgi:hypothetical protein
MGSGRYGSRYPQSVSTYRNGQRCKIKFGQTKRRVKGCGGPTFETDNEVWPDFGRNPAGRGHFSSPLCHSSLRYARYLSLLFPRSEKKWLPSLPIPIGRYTLIEAMGTAWDFRPVSGAGHWPGLIALCPAGVALGEETPAGTSAIAVSCRGCARAGRPGRAWWAGSRAGRARGLRFSRPSIRSQ